MSHRFGIEEWNAGVTTGVPQILCPTDLAEKWEGINLPSNGRILHSSFRVSSHVDAPVTDYDVACAVAMLPQEVGLIPIANSNALVVCGEIPFASWISAIDFAGGYILIPEFWTDAEPRSDCRNIVLSIDDQAYSDTGLKLTSTGEGFILFAATDCVTDADFESIKVDCPQGYYSVFSFFHDSSTFQLRVIRIKLDTN